ncbi:adenosine deaminase [Proteus hauseri]|uniref:adenosine deaminase n=1 Tax=Proteus hauseri TaxID=183417 RepID=UPI0010095E6D|nr:adenosine deaminase [Proteus hauseri]QAV24585.1 adenosine deaminase [Proteus hauseri]
MKHLLNDVEAFNPTILPKVELHVHLDTSLSYFYVKQIYPDMDLAEFNRTFVATEQCFDLGDFLSKITPQIDILQTKTAITLAVNDLFHQIKADNVIYAELRFAPLLHTKNGLTAKEVVEIVINAMNASAQKQGIQARLILCTLRHFNKAQSMQTAKLVVDYQYKGVVALDLAADEARFSLVNHIAAFDYVKKAGSNLIAHAGEAKGAESVNETLDKLQVTRIGHGVRSIEDMTVIEKLKNNNILLEVCPSCNIICNVYNTIEQHSVDKLKKQGVKLNINTDARTVANTTLNKEYQLLHDVFGWNKEDFQQCNIDAIEASFISKELKISLISKIRNEK